MEMNGGFLVTKIKQLGDRIFEKILRSCAALHAGTGSDDGMYLVMDAWTGTSSLDRKSTRLNSSHT